MSWNTCKQPECENYTARPDGDYCETCRRANTKESSNEKKSIEKRNSQIAKAQKRNQEPRKLPSKVSEKRKELNKEYSVLRLAYLANHLDCEVKLIGCGGLSVEIHHTASGTNKVAHLNDTATWKAICAHCHRILHDKLSAKESRELGLKI